MVISGTKKVKLGYRDVGWGFDRNGTLCLSTHQEVQGVVGKAGHGAALDDTIIVAVKRMGLLA